MRLTIGYICTLSHGARVLCHSSLPGAPTPRPAPVPAPQPSEVTDALPAAWPNIPLAPVFVSPLLLALIRTDSLLSKVWDEQLFTFMKPQEVHEFGEVLHAFAH